MGLYIQNYTVWFIFQKFLLEQYFKKIKKSDKGIVLSYTNLYVARMPLRGWRLKNPIQYHLQIKAAREFFIVCRNLIPRMSGGIDSGNFIIFHVAKKLPEVERTGKSKG